MIPSAPGLVALTALMAGAGSPAHADALRPCTLRVLAEPAEILLGEGEHATVRIETGGATPPRLETSAGRLRGVRQVGPGVFAAELIPPEETFPQLAIVAAFSENGCGWTSIRLVGQADAIVRSTAGARIFVRIAERTFGPAAADAAGIARLPVVIPPGVRVAYHGSRAIPLAIPPIKRVHVVLDRTSLRADEDAEVGVRVFATTDSGAPSPGARVALAASTGEVSSLTEVSPGELVGRWRLRRGLPRDETLVARIAGEPPQSAARLSRPAGPVARMEILPTAPAAAEDVEEVHVEIRTADAAGNPVDAQLEPEVDAGAASRPTRLGAGVSRFSVRLPDDARGQDRIEVKAAAGGVTARSAIALVPGQPARIAAVLSDPVLTADGRSTSRLRIAVLDRRGVPVAAAVPRVGVSEGVVAGVETEQRGRFVVAYRSPLRADDSTATVHVDAEGLASESLVRLLGSRGKLELAPSAGVALTTWRASLQSSVQVAAWTRRLGPDLGLAVEVGWSSTSERTAGTPEAPSLDGEATYLWLLGRVGWRRATSRRALLWVSGGAGAARASSAMRVSGVPSFSEVAWVPAAAASVAWGMRAWRGFPFVELGARWQGDPHLASLSGPLVPFIVSAGYRLETL